jgi:predicted acetylornithine/succinylornithine family transaminase
MNLIDREHQHFFQTYKRLPLEVARAEGMYVHTLDGERYLDFLGGIAVNSLGHSHPAIIAAVERQLHRYTHLSNYFYQDAQVEFVERLCAISGYDRAFLSNSGTEANEGAMKLARSWGSPQGKRGIIGFTGGFHGRTYGVLSIMEKPRYKDGMEPFLPETAILPFNDVDALRAAVNDGTCAVVLEFLQGEGGIRRASDEFVKEVFALRERFGFLVVADEVQAGGGRTGRFFSFDGLGVHPDIVTLAKGIGGGLPLGAILADEAVAGIWSSGQHGTTFGGNALACAAGSAVIDALKDGAMEHVGAVGEYMQERLRELAGEFPDLVRDVRGAGAIAGVELAVPAGPVVDAMLRRRVIINATDETVVRLLPPFIVQPEHVDEMVAALRECFAEMLALKEL